MAVPANNVLTLHDWAKRLDPDGKVPSIVELLSQTNEIVADAMFIEGNLPTGHRTTVRTGLPVVAWRLLNNGVAAGKSTTAQLDEQCGMLEAWSEVDKDLAELNGNTSSFRLSEGMSFIEAMNQEMATTMFYGNTSITPEKFTGLSVRYSSLAAGNAQNIIDAGGTGTDNASVWLVNWGYHSLCGIFPKGSRAGLVHEDLGLITVETANGIGGGRMRAYRDHWQWKVGVALKDWRYVVRIANIDVSNLVTESAAANLTKAMIRSMYRLPSQSLGKNVFYMNRTAAEMLDIQRLNSVGGGGMVESMVDGKRTMMFRGVPIRVCDALLNTEARVV